MVTKIELKAKRSSFQHFLIPAKILRNDHFELFSTDNFDCILAERDILIYFHE